MPFLKNISLFPRRNKFCLARNQEGTFPLGIHFSPGIRQSLRTSGISACNRNTRRTAVHPAVDPDRRILLRATLREYCCRISQSCSRRSNRHGSRCSRRRILPHPLLSHCRTKAERRSRRWPPLDPLCPYSHCVPRKQTPFPLGRN